MCQIYCDKCGDYLGQSHDCKCKNVVLTVCPNCINIIWDNITEKKEKYNTNDVEREYDSYARNIL